MQSIVVIVTPKVASFAPDQAAKPRDGDSKCQDQTENEQDDAAKSHMFAAKQLDRGELIDKSSTFCMCSCYEAEGLHAKN